jgi:uncharacterized protein (TIGR02145 family)
MKTPIALHTGSKSIVAFAVLLFSTVFFSCSDETPDSPIEYGTVSDIEGKVYKTVKIGNRWWMAENLSTGSFRNGDPIQFVSATDSANWVLPGRPAYSRYQDLSTTTGYLYNHACVADGRGLAPQGWHIATDEDWKELEVSVGMTADAAGKTGWRGNNEADLLKKTGLDHWKNYDGVWALDRYGFSATAGGCRLFDARFSYPSGNVFSGFWWTSTPHSNGESWYRHMDYKSSAVFRSHSYVAYGMSVRCVKD